jgi:predicted GNAT family N-acyltransferase
MESEIVILDKTHIRSNFECGNPTLDNYIQKQVSQDVKRELAACYVLCDNLDKTVIGYYTLSSHSIKFEELPEDLRNKLPPAYKDIPTALLGRLAVSKARQGKRLGQCLLIDALNRCAALSENIGTLAVMVDPIDEKAVSFYEAYGFINLPDSARMFIPIKTIKASQTK